MKSILISIKPKYVAKILNGEKTIEIRKTAPKCELPIDVYIYCTKGEEKLIKSFDIDDGPFFARNKEFFDNGNEYLNGKVVAKFHLEKIKAYVGSTYIPEEGIVLPYKVNLWQESDCGSRIEDAHEWGVEESKLKEILKASCLTEKELALYISKESEAFVGFNAWHISDLVIFDKPRELREFKKWKISYPKRIKWASWESNYYTALGAYVKQHPTMIVSEIKRTFDESISMKKAPQSWCYVEEKD